VDKNINHSGEIYKIAEFLNTVTGIDYSSEFPKNQIQRLIFGDPNILALILWADTTDPDYSKYARWVVIKEGCHHPRETGLLDLFTQFHLFGDQLLEPYPHGLKVIHHDLKTELFLLLDPKDYVYLRGTVSTKPLT
jgi:hypothetical protein